MGLRTHLSQIRSSLFFPLWLSLTRKNCRWKPSSQFLTMGLNATQMLHVFLATQASYGYKNVSTYLTNLKAAPCCGMHVPASEKTWEENHKEDCREHPVLHILLTRDLDYLLWASLFFPAITREEKTLSELREVGSRGSKTTGTGLSRWWRLSPGLSSVPTTLSLPLPAHA